MLFKKLLEAAAIFFVAALCVLCVLAGWFAPYDAQHEDRSHAYHPPARLHFIDTEGKFHLIPFVYPTRVEFDSNLKRYYVEDRRERYSLRLGGRKLFSVDAPARLYLWGTDSRGRDLFSRCLYGARVSLSIGCFGALVSTLLGLLVGGIAGHYGGRTDQILMRLSEFFIMIPGLYLLLALRGALPVKLASQTVYLLIVTVLSFISWGGIARVIRGMVMSLRERDYVLAARVLGRRESEILIRHVLPHTLSYVLVVLSASIPGFVFGESALSLLGLGIQEPQVSWGNLMTESLSVAHLYFHPWMLAPGFLVMFTSLFLYVLADILQERSGGNG